MKDWYPNVKRQSSAAPYVLNVSDESGNFNRWSWQSPTYGSKTVQTVRLSGLMSGNGTEKFIGFLITAKNEFDDEVNGNFISPFPAGASRMECKDEQTSQMIEVVKNSTSGNWSSIEIKWMAPEKHPGGKITISASVVKEHGVYWDGISVTLDHHCSGPRCANSCPNDVYAKTKFGCTTCKCAGAAISGNLLVLLFAALSLVFYFMINWDNCRINWKPE
ncbi:hypothetical protein OS493_023063 [Desmophyllum pertusum]|uniref:Reelin domain-containing protein n=1 Tax=Desmophyllum pertusum TaxID=174260 RepID=A0A9X0CRN8_9CNID|nr:hypothetical protein OS493_023063 [Desmophyllum pertusum]